MVGVLIGGGLTFATQRTTQRTAERIEERKRETAKAEARRTEQIEAVIEFIRSGTSWYKTARPAVDGLRVAEKTVELLCDASLRKPAEAYQLALNEAVWKKREAKPLAEVLEHPRKEFLAAARKVLTPDEQNGIDLDPLQTPRRSGRPGHLSPGLPQIPA